jgi:nitroreductase
MEIPYDRWYPAVSKRRSRRLFKSDPVPPDLIRKLLTCCNEFRPFDGARAVLVTASPDKVLKGAIGSYGKIKGAPAFIAFIGDMGDPNVQEKVGYTGEGIILEATSLRLGTCWVGVSFRPEIAASLTGIRENEKVLAVTPVGFASEKVSFEEKIMTGFGMTHKRKPLTGLVTGLDETKWPDWIRASLKAARIAPSAVNRQPWRFYVEPDGITISVDDLNDTYHIAKRLDCGIAMLHVETALLSCGVKGEWKFLKPPGVAMVKGEIK